jgi:hypothetical protein
MPTRRRILGAGLETRGHGAHAIDRDRGAAMGLRAFAHPTLLSHEHRRWFSVVRQRKIREQRRKRERHHQIGLDRAPPGRLDFEIERVRSGVDEIVERIAACSFASALGAPRRGTRSRAPARCFGFAFMPAFALLRHCGLIRSRSSAHSRARFSRGSIPAGICSPRPWVPTCVGRNGMSHSTSATRTPDGGPWPGAALLETSAIA